MSPYERLAESLRTTAAQNEEAVLCAPALLRRAAEAVEFLESELADTLAELDRIGELTGIGPYPRADA